MNSIGGQKINLSTLLRSSLLKDSGKHFKIFQADYLDEILWFLKVLNWFKFKTVSNLNFDYILGRYALVESELFKLTDRSNKEYSLAPVSNILL